MNRSIKTQIANLMILVALLPTIFILVLTLIQREQVGRTISGELSTIAENNLGQIAKDVRGMLVTSNDLITQRIETGQNTVNSMITRRGVAFASGTDTWNAVNQSTNQARSVELPRMLIGGEWLRQNTDASKKTVLVDEVEHDLKMICTVFQRMDDSGDLLRIATNVKTDDGKRAIGTYIPAVEPDGKANPVVSAILRGQNYQGPAVVLGEIYVASYSPIRGADGKVVGAISVAIRQEAVESIRQNILNIKIGSSGYVYVIGAKGKQRGVYIISQNGKSDGKDIYNAKDSDGNFFVQNIVKRALDLKPGEIAFEYYPWTKEGSTVRSMKIAAITYFEPWDWVIGASAYMDEFTAAQRKASASLAQLVMAIIITSLIGIAVAAGIAFWFGARIARPVRQVANVAKEVARGNLMISADVNRKDEIGQLAVSMETMMESLRAKAEVAEKIAAGDLKLEVPIASDEDTLGHSMAKMKDTIARMLSNVQELIASVQEGNLQARGDVSEFTGGWSDLVMRVNDLIEAFVKPIKMTSENIEKIAIGEIPDKITEEYRGDFNVIKDNLNFCIDAIDHLVVDTKMLVSSALEGELGTRANPEQHRGDYREIVSGINQTLDAVTAPVQEAQSVLEKMAAGDLSDEMKGDYKGDHAAIKKALNGSLDSLNNLLLQVMTAMDQVNSGATQVSSASQSLSQGATEQAASLEEVSSSMTEVGSQTRQNAENALQANQLAVSARSSADDGNTHMKGMLSAMTEINNKSAEIQKIIKAIDEIAFQTNLLALNAAVEAARAGVHGKGFAVVAEEVRNLAQRSAKAAKETTDLIDGNVAAVENGSKIADQTAKALQEITEGVTKVTDLVNEIAAASREQTTAVDQIGEALGQIDQVTQANTANAEESAAAAEELSGQSEQLSEMLKRFRLKDFDGSEKRLLGSGSTGKKDRASGFQRNKDQRQAKHTQVSGLEIGSGERINLDDADFGDF